MNENQNKGMSTEQIDALFNTASNAFSKGASAIANMNNAANNMFGNDSRRNVPDFNQYGGSGYGYGYGYGGNNHQPAPPQAPLNYGYGYGINSQRNIGSGMFGSYSGTSSQYEAGYPGFYNPGYGNNGGMY